MHTVTFLHTMDATTFRAARVGLKMSQSELADRLGIDRTHVSRMESARAAVGRSVARGVGILNALDLLDGNDKPLAVKLRAVLEEGLAG